MLSSLDKAGDHVTRFHMSHVYSPASAKLQMYLPDWVRIDKAAENLLIIVACRTRDQLEELIANATEKRLPYELERTPSTNVWYTTIAAAKNYIQQECVAGKLERSRLAGAYIFLYGAEKFDPAAYAIYILREAYLSKIEAGIILFTHSPFCWLEGYSKFSPFVYPSGTEIKYTPKLPTLREPFLVVGEPIDHPKAINISSGDKIPTDVRILINNSFHGKQRPTKLAMFLAENLLSSGTIYRLTTAKVFNSLVDSYPAKGNLRKIIAGFVGSDLAEALELIDDKYRKQYTEVLESVKKYGESGTRFLRIVASIPLNYDSSFFLAKWFHDTFVDENFFLREKEAADERGEVLLDRRGNEVTLKPFVADYYCGCLVAALIDTKPNYGDLSEYVGRDDIETLLNFWDAIMIATNNTAFNIQSDRRTDNMVFQWCVRKRLNVKPIKKLCKKVGDLITFRDLGPILAKYPSVYGYSQKVGRTNRIRLELANIYPMRRVGALDFSQSLPQYNGRRQLQRGDTIHSLMEEGNKVFIYFTETTLLPPSKIPSSFSFSSTFLDDITFD